MRKSVALLASVLLLGSPLLAAAPQGAVDSATKNLQDDIRFARDLAKLGYFDLAVSWLSKIEARPNLDAAVKGDVLLAKAEIARLASENAQTRDERRKYYDDGADLYKKALENLGAAMTADKGEAIVNGYVNLLVSRGEFYTQDLNDARDSGAPDAQQAALKKVADDSFREAIKSVNAAHDELVKASTAANATDAEKERLTALAQFAAYTRGQSYYLWAMVYDDKDPNRSEYLHQCAEKLTDFIWDVGESNFFAFYAYFYWGMAEWELGRLEPDKANGHDAKALANLNHIHGEGGLDLAALADPQTPPDERAFGVELFEKSYWSQSQVFRSVASRYEKNTGIADNVDLGKESFDYLIVKSPGNDKPWCITAPVYKPALVQALRSASMGCVDEMEKRLKDKKLDLSDYGYMAQLEKATTLIDTGNTNAAITIAKAVADKNKKSAVGAKAGKLLATLLGGDDSGPQPASVLDLAAKGLMADGKFIDAAAKLQQVAAACTTDEDKKTYLAKSWEQMGLCYMRVDHVLEAALAFESGFNAARDLKEDAAMADLATKAHDMWNRRFIETKQDFDKTQRDRVGEMAKQFAGAEDIDYQQGREKFSNAQSLKEKKDRDAQKKAYDDAAASFAKVPETAATYELALVYLGRCQQETGDLQGAVKTFNAMLARAADPKKSVGLDVKKSANRDIALAEGTYYLGETLLALKQFDDVLKTLDGYETKFAKQKDFFGNVVAFRVEALCGLDRLDEADKLMATMLGDAEMGKSAAANHPLTILIRAHYDKYKKLIGTETDPTKIPAAAAELKKTADLQAKANERNQYNSYANLSSVAQWYSNLHEDALAVANFKKLLEVFGNDQKHLTEQPRVKATLAKSLVNLHKFDESEAIARELLAAEPKSAEAMTLLAKSAGGWMEVQMKSGGAEFVEIPGTGKYAEAMPLWIGLAGAHSQLSKEWWEAKTNSLFCLYMQAKADPSMKDQVKVTIQSWERDLDFSKAPEPQQSILNRIKQTVQ